jgi:chromosome partitioning protein
LRFLDTLRIPVIATLRDSQNYVRAAELGVGLHEMKHWTVAQDLADWEPLLAWLKEREVPAVTAGAAQHGRIPESA